MTFAYSNVTVAAAGPDIAIHFVMNGDRYHFFIPKDDPALSFDGVVYRRPLDGIKRGMPGYFRTSQQNAAAQRWQPIIKDILQLVRGRKMIDAAIRQDEENKNTARKVFAAHQRDKYKSMKGPALYNLLKAMAEYWQNGTAIAAGSLLAEEATDLIKKIDARCLEIEQRAGVVKAKGE